MASAVNRVPQPIVSKLRGVLRVLGLLLVMSFTLGPIVWIIDLSLKSEREALASPTWIFKPTVENYVADLHGFFIHSLVNSAITSTGVSVLAMGIALPAAYAIVRSSNRWLRYLVDYNFAARTVPGLIFLVPLFVAFREVGLLDSYLGLILAFQVLCLPVAVGSMLGFFADIPREIEEAAAIDGASTVRVFASIGLPLVRQGILATTTLTFMIAWNEFVYALALTGNKTITGPVAILNFIRYEQVEWGNLAAGVVLMMIPSVVFGLAASRILIQGFATSGVKG